MKASHHNSQRNAHRRLEPPGCWGCTAGRPDGTPIHVGVVQQHRFAFYYWAVFARDNRQEPPILVTLDFHNDVSGDVRSDDLNNLDIYSDDALGSFAWRCLHPQNDDHVLPALRLDFFSDVYALRGAKVTRHAPLAIKGKAGNDHRALFFANEAQLLDAMPPRCDAYLDIDLDFFTLPLSPSRTAGEERPWHTSDIRRFMRRRRGIIQRLLPSLRGVTIALEPRCCGGLMNSLRILEVVNQELFGGAIGARHVTMGRQQ
jgi:hypothetical protein